MKFECYVCSASVSSYELEELTREGAPCPNCGANVRLRGLAYLVGLALHGRSIGIAAWPPRPDKLVLGVSDVFFARFLRSKVRYLETRYDARVAGNAAFLDVANPPVELIATADVVMCSEVLEHVVPPVQAAFAGLFSLLKPGGTLVFSVPYTLEERTIEHYPELHDWQLVTTSAGNRIIQNTTSDGHFQEFSNVVFHGGGDAVVEMRVFALPDLKRNLRDAGFVDISVLAENAPEFGVQFQEPWSRLITARRVSQ